MTVVFDKSGYQFLIQLIRVQAAGIYVTFRCTISFSIVIIIIITRKQAKTKVKQHITYLEYVPSLFYFIRKLEPYCVNEEVVPDRKLKGFNMENNLIQSKAKWRDKSNSIINIWCPSLKPPNINYLFVVENPGAK